MCDKCAPEWQEYQKIENPTMADWIRAGGTTDQWVQTNTAGV